MHSVDQNRPTTTTDGRTGRLASDKAASLPFEGNQRGAPAQNDPIFHVVPWTEGLALRAARIDRDLPHSMQARRLRQAIDGGVLPREAVRALVSAGFHELDDMTEVPEH